MNEILEPDDPDYYHLCFDHYWPPGQKIFDRGGWRKRGWRRDQNRPRLGFFLPTEFWDGSRWSVLLVILEVIIITIIFQLMSGMPAGFRRSGRRNLMKYIGDSMTLSCNVGSFFYINIHWDVSFNKVIHRHGKIILNFHCWWSQRVFLY